MRIALLLPESGQPPLSGSSASLASQLADGLGPAGVHVLRYDCDPVRAAQLYAAAREFDLIHDHLGYATLGYASLVDVPVIATLYAAPDDEQRGMLASSAAVCVACGFEGDDGSFAARFDADEGLVDATIALYEQLLEQRENYRPWGFYLILEDQPEHKVKRIHVYPQQRLSYQKHRRRSEHWNVIRGTAVVTLDGQDITLVAGEAVDIPVGTAHRVRNPGDEPMEFIEVQTGDYFGEDDIIRLEDDYGRVE